MDSKSRNLTIYDYLTVLQTEYIVTQLRKKIATRSKDKLFYDRVLSHKKEKIIDICNRNVLPSIFTSDEEDKRIRGKVYKLWGLPIFIYRDEKEKIDLIKRDIYNYLSEQSEVRILGDNQNTMVGTIVSSKYFLDQLDDYEIIEDIAIHVQINGETNSRPVLVKHISRIL